MVDPSVVLIRNRIYLSSLPKGLRFFHRFAPIAGYHREWFHSWRIIRFEYLVHEEGNSREFETTLDLDSQADSRLKETSNDILLRKPIWSSILQVARVRHLAHARSGWQGRMVLVVHLDGRFHDHLRIHLRDLPTRLLQATKKHLLAEQKDLPRKGTVHPTHARVARRSSEGDEEESYWFASFQVGSE